MSGRPIFTAVVHEVAEREGLAKQLPVAQKLDAVRQQAGDIAHGLNNLLTGIAGFADLAQEAVGPQHPAFEDIAEVIRSAEKAAALTRELVALGGLQVLQRVQK